MNLLQEFSQELFQFFHHYPLPTLFVLITLEEAGLPLPVPGDTLIVLAGAQPDRNWVFGVLLIIIASVAVFIGSSALFFLMQRGGRRVLLKYGKFLHFSEKRLDQVERWFVKRGPVAIVVGRLIPGLRIPTTIVAGLSGMPYREYAISASLAAIIWASLYYFLGVVVGKSYSLVIAQVTNLLDTIPRAVLVTAIIIFIAAGVWGFLHIRQRLRDRAARRALEKQQDA
jgi:membrane protein DedA with SNARE-associated domain